MRIVLVGILLPILSTASLLARTVTWTLDGVTFSDGASASGSFEFDHATQTAVDWNISVSGGDESIFPPFTYSPATSCDDTSAFGFGPSFQENSSLRQLRLVTAINLPTSGGTIPLDTSEWPRQAMECFDCNPYRRITAGRLQAESTDPEPRGWDRASGGNGHYYQVVPLAGSWSEADEFARTLSFQGMPAHLVTITSQQEQDFVESLLPRDGPFSANYWVGLSDRDSEGTFEWVTREPLSFTNWAEGEPNDFGTGEDVTAIRWNVECEDSNCVSTANWNDLADSGEQGFERLGPFPIIEFERGPGPHELQIAQFGSGQTLRFELALFNRSSTEPADGTVYFWDPSGTPLDPSGFVSGDVRFELPPLGSITYSTTGEGEIVTGSILVSSDRPVGGVVRFTLPDAGLAGIGSSQPYRAAIVSVRREGALSSGVAIRNAGKQAVTVDLTLKGENGQVVTNGVATRDLPLNGRVSEFIEQYFPDADTANFVGTMCIEARGGLIAVVGLELEVGGENPKFTALPVAPLN